MEQHRLVVEQLTADLSWSRWDEIIATHGITIDRPRDSRHPSHPEIIYPIDYGFVDNTVGEDGDEVDIFVGTAARGLVALIVTSDYRKGDAELKLIHHCTPAEIYLVNGFINFDRELMEGTLMLRWPMHELGARSDIEEGK